MTSRADIAAGRGHTKSKPPRVRVVEGSQFPRRLPSSSSGSGGVTQRDTRDVRSVFTSFRITASIASVVSAWSVASVASVLCLLCVLGLGSFASTASVLSIASTASVLSIGSVGSVLSMGSTGCVMKHDKNCWASREAPKAAQHVWEIRYSASTWDEVKGCTQEEYKAEERADECEYKIVTCVVDGHVDDTCKVRRKGTSTWRDLDNKPSFKVKLDDTREIGTYECLNEICPPGQTQNVWQTKKFTLNNQAVWDGEIDAYEMYRSYIPAPLAVQVAVVLYRDDVLQSNHTYAMVETVDDSKFVQKWFGEDTAYRLYEVELGVSKWQRGNGEYHVDDDQMIKAPKASTLPLANVNRNNALRYHAVSTSTKDWDSACGWDNNYFLLHDATSWHYVPWGVDRAFWHEHSHRTYDNCMAVNECLEDSSCASEYENIISSIEANSEFRKPAFNDPSMVVAINILVTAALLLMVALICKVWKAVTQNPSAS